MPYSYTQFSTFNKCPAKFKYKYLDKLRIPKPPAPAAARGLEVHKSIEEYLRKEKDTVHEAVAFYGTFLTALRDAPIKIEAPFGLDEKFEYVPYDDPNAVIRGFIDCYLEDDESLHVYEWKTGKFYPEHEDQRLLYAIAALQMAPKQEAVEVMGVYLDQKANAQRTYYRAVLDGYIHFFKLELDKVRGATEFPPQPNYLCRFCEYSSMANKGPCQF